MSGGRGRTTLPWPPLPWSKRRRQPSAPSRTTRSTTWRRWAAVEHANSVTRSYGIEIMSINIISAAPVDDALTKPCVGHGVGRGPHGRDDR